MSTAQVVVVVVGLVLVVAALVAIGAGNRPWKGNTTAAGQTAIRHQTRSDRLTGKADRPADPSAETMDPERLGGDHRPPGPSARSNVDGDGPADDV